MQAVLRAKVVHEVECLDRHAFVREYRSQLVDGRLIGPVTPSYGQRGFVQPQHVAAVGSRRCGESGNGGDPEVGELGGKEWRFACPHLFGPTELQDTATGDKRWVIHEAGVTHVVGGRESLNRAAKGLKQGHECCMLVLKQVKVQRLRPVRHRVITST